MRIAYSDELELYPASKMQDISKHSHNAKLTFHSYAHIWAGQEVRKLLLCKHIVVSDL